MLDLLQRTYLSVFRRYPMLGRFALLVVLGEVAQSSVNNYSLSFFILDDLHQPGRVLGTLISMFLIAEMLLKLPFGNLSDHHGRRKYVMLGISMSAATATAICVIPTDTLIALPILIYLVLLPLRAVDGVGAASLWPPLFAAVPDNVPSEERSVAMSVMNTGYMAGMALGPALAGGAMALWKVLGCRPDWDGKAPFAMVIVAAAVALMLASRLRDTSDYESHVTNGQPGEWPRGAIVAIIIIITLGNTFATGTVAPYLAPFVNKAIGIPPQAIGLLLLALFLPAGLLGIPLGHLGDRWPKRRVVQVALCITTAGLWAVARSTSIIALVIAGIVVALGFMLGLPAWLALISDLAPQGRAGRVMGLMATAQGAGAFLGPLAGGYLWDFDIRLPFYVAASALSLSALVALTLLGRTRSAGA
jgi:DHA1 family multidrug resistance protein-like MFS transporter